MKILNYIFAAGVKVCALVLSAMLLGGCEDGMPFDASEYSFKPHYLYLEESEYTTSTSAAQSIELAVKAHSDQGWQFDNIPDWITVTPSSGTGSAAVIAKLAENSQVASRTAIMSLKSSDSDWGYSTPFTITQERALQYVKVELTDNTYIFAGSADDASIPVASNVTIWSAEALSNLSDWCKVEKSADNCSVELTVSANTGNTARSGQVMLSTADVSTTFTVIQRAAGISSTTEKMKFEFSGGTKSLQVESEADWTAFTSSSWISINSVSGSAGSSTVSVTALANNSYSSRSGYVYLILSESNKIEIPISQEGIELKLNPAELAIAADGGTGQVSVTSNSPWLVVEPMPDWVTVTPTTENGNTTISITASKNPNLVDRDTLVSIRPLTMEESRAVRIHQTAQAFQSDSTALHFSDGGGTMPVSITTGANWTASAVESWLSVTPQSGIGNGIIQVTAAENLSYTSRTGHINLGNTTINVYQTGKYINLSGQAFEYESKGGSKSLSIATNTEWTAVAGESWILLSKTEGKSGCDITITVQDNPAATQRIGTLTITPKENSPISITITQKPRYLTLGVEDINFSGDGGTSETYTYSTDGIVAFETGADWLTVDTLGGNSFTVTVTENVTSNSRKDSIRFYLTDLESGTISRTVTVFQSACLYVDLGLSVKWATRNVGATQPYEYGDYFAWGATEPYYESGYAQSSSPVWKSGKSGGYTFTNAPYQTVSTESYSSTRWTKYLGSTTSDYKDASATDADALKTVLDAEDDAATANWGGIWRLPTKAEQDELRSSDNCTWTWYASGNSEYNGIAGYKVTSKKSGYTDRSIFLPASGLRWDAILYDVGSYGYYWSGSLYTDYPYGANGQYFKSGYYYWNGIYRYYGCAVRPVCPNENSVVVSSITLNKSSLSLETGETETLTATVLPENATDKTLTWSSSNESVATVSGIGQITAVAPGSCTITAQSSSGSVKAECQVAVTAPAPNYEYVDLGLSVKWATFNVGATQPYEYGDYFAWGATEPYYESGYAQSDSPVWKSGKSGGYTFTNAPYQTVNTEVYSSTRWTKYLGSTTSGYKAASATDADALKTVLDAEDDAATANWGGTWRMPTYAEMEELSSSDNCTRTWYASGNSEYNGIAGYKVTSKKSGYTDRSIFLPASGYRWGTYLDVDGSVGVYWSSSLDTDSPVGAYGLYFDSEDYDWSYYFRRYDGFAVRPVCQ